MKDESERRSDFSMEDMRKSQTKMSVELYLHSEKRPVLKNLDQEITVQLDILRELKFKNQRTDMKVNANDGIKKLIAMMAEIEILKAKKAEAESFCSDKYSMSKYQLDEAY